jgi:hypothetical protein
VILSRELLDETVDEGSSVTWVGFARSHLLGREDVEEKRHVNGGAKSGQCGGAKPGH